uniref:Uncharacterized protein n=1 Tax=Arundo donax TaxID=35708 RepID=A0A0A8XWZ5_ARUDO
MCRDLCLCYTEVQLIQVSFMSFLATIKGGC